MKEFYRKLERVVEATVLVAMFLLSLFIIVFFITLGVSFTLDLLS